jgi:serine/threonine-protein kinase ATR
MLSPYFPKISTVLVSGKLDTLNEATQFLGLSRASFVESTILYTVPSLVLREDRSTLETIANVVNKALGILLIDHPMLMPYILKAIFMQKDNAMVKRKSNWFVDSLQDLRVGTYTISMGNLVSQNLVNLLVEIIVDLGDDYTKPKAEVALERLLQQSHPPGQAFGPEAMSNWLKNNMLGIMIGISDIMHDLRGKRTASEKSKVIRSLGGLIDYVGLAMSGFSSQVRIGMAFVDFDYRLNLFYDR